MTSESIASDPRPHIEAIGGGPRGVENEPINILIVDDEPKNLTALETVLEDPGYRLVRAESANEALLALVAQEFALLILDVQMPEMNGFELAQMIKKRKKTATVPIIFLTAFYSDDEHVLEGYNTGAVDYLHKPINAAVLRSKVAVFAELARKSREIAMANKALTDEAAERQRVQSELRELNRELERRVNIRTADLTQSEARFRALAEEMPHLVWETDTTGRSTFQNLKWRTFTGLANEAKNEDWTAIIHPEDIGRMRSEWSVSMQTGVECDTHCRYRRASDGEYRWFRVKAAPVRDASGTIVRWVGTCTDIHEQRIAEEALEEADRRKDEFLAMLGHELRNPLAAIRHAVRIDGESNDDVTARKWASVVIDRQSAQLSRMVDDLLDVERINRGRITLRPEPLELPVVLGRAVEVVRSLMDQKRHVLCVDMEASSLWVQGDAARLEQIFVNILNNAVKYTPEGGEIHLGARAESGEAVVTVSDNGVGIPPDLLPHVFDLFRQAQTSLDRAQGGLGIGLTVVKTLTEMHGGRVFVESGGSRGTSFTVRLPLAEARPAGTSDAVALPQTEAPRRLRVLIVDDHVDAAQTLARLLVRRNFEVRVSHDGPSGIVAAGEFLPEVFLLDLGLPGLDGYELVGVLRADPRFDQGLFVAISGYALETDRARSISAGFHHHCAKPVDFEALLALLQEWAAQLKE